MYSFDITTKSPFKKGGLHPTVEENPYQIFHLSYGSRQDEDTRGLGAGTAPLIPSSLPTTPSPLHLIRRTGIFSDLPRLKAITLFSPWDFP
jgi:hypothetical protein